MYNEIANNHITLRKAKVRKQEMSNWLGAREDKPNIIRSIVFPLWLHPRFHLGLF